MSSTKSIEEKYQKKTHHEHILELPDTYIGSVEMDKSVMWVFNEKVEKMEKREIEFVPGLYKIFDEILVNTRDQTVRCKSCKTIKVSIDKENGSVEVWNDGAGIDVVIHKEHKIYIPELIFGHLLTSTNYDKSEKKIVGGKNGYGSKLCLKKGTLIPTFDGKIVEIEKLQIGDKLIGDDGMERTILDKLEGKGRLFEVTQDKCEPYTVNGDHILCLRMPDHKTIFWDSVDSVWNMLWLNREENRIQKKVDKSFSNIKEFAKTIYDDNTIDMSIKDYIELDDAIKYKLTGYVGECVQWKHKDVQFDPYVLGSWLGEHTGETKILECNDKYIPTKYIVNSRDVRLKVLAGLIDSDGSVLNSGTQITIIKDVHYWKLVNDIKFLARSLGFMCHVSINKAQNNCNINISGYGIEYIPTLLLKNKCSPPINKDNRGTGILQIKEVEYGDFVGLAVDGNKRFVLEDFTVTHNCAIYSTMFQIETVDAKTKKKYTQNFTENMYKIAKPKIKNLKSPVKPYTKITFKPDFARFGLDGFTNDILALMYKRVYDIAACTRNVVKVYLNDKLININGFDKYVDYFYPNTEEANTEENNAQNFNLEKCKVYEEVNDRWRACLVFNPENGYEHVSFVNGISTYKGGTHVDYVVNQIVKEMIAAVKKKNKSIKLKPSQIKDNFTIFLDSVIVNPSFGSQTKEELVSKKDSFGSTCEFTKKFFQKISKTGLVDELIEFGKLKEQSILKKTDGKKTGKVFGVPKLDDANKAGTKQSSKCKIILTEGDSAKALAIAGLSVIGKDYYGVFPLKGKLLNVREASPAQMLNNDEITNLKKILGLRHDVVYKDTAKLRYGGIVIFTDQDVDGSHIKGLIINFIHYFWPSLAKLEGFITCLTTPILKVTKKKKVLEFYNLSEYDKWLKKGLKGWSKPKYYKGLGTSTATEARRYFQDFEKKLIKYYWSKEDIEKKLIDVDSDNESIEPTKSTKSIKSKDTETDTEEMKKEKKNKCYDAITLAFEKKRADDRKEWLKKYSINQFLDNENKKISYSDFIHKELIHFSKDDNDRSLPCFVDGLKIGQRKIYFVSELKNLHNQSKEIRVAQLSGAVSEKANYHHGEVSLCGTIVNMAQNYVGSNNINLMEPNGQFGTRLDGGKDSASPRYIYTRFTSIAHKIFRKEDFPILDRIVDDGTTVEPKWYIPIIPMILVNGSDGIGTGFSTSVPCFNPKDIVANIFKKLDGHKMTCIKPWYRNFRGHIIKAGGGKYEIRGEFKQINENTLEITELPIGQWTSPYKNFLGKITIGTNSDKKLQKKEMIEDFEDKGSDVSVKFIVKFPEGKLDELIEKGTLENKLKLVSTKSTTNMHLHCANGLEIKKYDSPEQIIEDFYDVRLECYQKRKDYLLIKYQIELDIISWRRKFIKWVVQGKIKVFKQQKKVINEKLEELGFPKMGKNPLKEFNDNDSDEISENKDSYEYLLSIKIDKFTQDELDKLDEEYNTKTNIYNELKATAPENMWRNELEEFMDAYKKWDKEQTIVFNENSSKKKTLKV